eukprot:TRINITY_DN13641_c2_g1_i1.p1 TRINITY_DN13641_c2_g1~~TRINITY_DN13641_c2_g1_i1.p1  ORF type:complete len:457 (+),score=144.81 TRINITY_DN13641_c2_g1_i1:107-1372(+)
MAGRPAQPSARGRPFRADPAPMFVCQECRKCFRVDSKTGLTVQDGVRTVLTPDVAGMFWWLDPKAAAQGGEARAEPEMADGQLRSVVSALQQYAADKSGIDHPLCRECVEERTLSGMAGLAGRLQQALADVEVYREQAAVLEAEEVAQSEVEDAEGAALAELRDEEAGLREQLERLEEEEEELRRQEEEITAAEEAHEADLNAFWQEIRQCTVDETRCTEAIAGLERKLSHVQDDLQTLSRTNLLNAAFHIWHDGHFGTINNLRLGKMPGQPSEINALNAAWGNAALLLVTLARKRGITFKRYRIIPRGTSSMVDDTKKTLELWMGVKGPFAGRRHDSAIVGFCACLYELCMDCSAKMASLVGECTEDAEPPYRIDENGHRVGGLYVKIGADHQTEEKWTRAMKYMLLDLKWALYITSNYA